VTVFQVRGGEAVPTAVRRFAAAVVLALVAVACGTRVSDQQAADEAREDARRAGLAARSAVVGGEGASGGEDVAGVDGGPAAGPTPEGTAAPGGGGTGTGSGGTATGPGGAGGAGGSGGPTATLPPGGNGGATDVGVTASEIKVGWVGTLTGPVPGLFRGALIGTQAFTAYQNSQGGLFGRRIRVVPADDALDSGKNRAGHLQLKDQVFAFVGSFSVVDDGGISVLRDCGCPDIGAALTRAHAALPNTFSPQPQRPGWRTGGLNYFKQHYPKDVIEHVAQFVAAVQSAREIAADQRRVMEALGYKIVYSREVQPNETNYTGDVIQMRNRGVRMITFQGEVGQMARLANAMYQQNFKVDLPNWGNAIYDSNVFKIAPKQALEGSMLDQVYALFLGEDAGRIPEVALFNQWMRRIDPNQPLDLFAMYGWISARLFVEAAQKVGPQLTRAKLLDTLRGMGSWDANGMIAPVNIGQKRPSDCGMLFTIRDGKFVRVLPTDNRNFDCSLGGYMYL
jgi:ABC-type branched-subunit amino acid transport system substrate-binding protein